MTYSPADPAISWNLITPLTYTSAAGYEEVVNLTTVLNGPGVCPVKSMFTVEVTFAFGYEQAANDLSSICQVRGVVSRGDAGAPVVTGTSLLSSGNAAGDTGNVVMNGDDTMLQCKTTFIGDVIVSGLWRVIGPLTLPDNP